MKASYLLIGTAMFCVPSVAHAQDAETKTYRYDALGRLISVESEGTVNDQGRQTFCFDAAGNRTDFESSLSGAAASCMTDGSPTPTPTPTPTPGTGDSFSINNVTGLESTNLQFTVTRSGPASGIVTIDYATADGSGADKAEAPGDYTASSPQTLTFNDGQLTKTVTVTVIDDSNDENDEHMFVNLSNVSGAATISDSQGMGTITDNDDPPPGNNPPNPVADSISAPRCSNTYYDVIANDTDPEGHALTLISVSTNDNIDIFRHNDSEVWVFMPYTNGTYNFTYVVEDSLGAQATGSGTVSVFGPSSWCSGGGF